MLTLALAAIQQSIPNKNMKKRFFGAVVTVGLIGASHAASLFGVTADNLLVSFDTATPNVFSSSVAITGLVGADGVTPNANGAILNLSARPGVSPGQFQLFGIDNSANIYTIGLGGAATLVSTGFSPSSFNAGFSYDPFHDNFVFAGTSGENYSVALDGGVSLGASFTYTGAGSASLFGLAIDPLFGTVFGVDAANDSLSTSTNPLFPTNSEMTVVGGLGVDVTAFGGIVADWDGNLYASLSTDGLNSSLYSINPSTGQATAIGNFANGVTSLAVPEPSATLLGAMGALALLRRRRA